MVGTIGVQVEAIADCTEASRVVAVLEHERQAGEEEEQDEKEEEEEQQGKGNKLGQGR